MRASVSRHAALTVAAGATLTLPLAVRGMIDHGFSADSAGAGNAYLTLTSDNTGVANAVQVEQLLRFALALHEPNHEVLGRDELILHLISELLSGIKHLQDLRACSDLKIRPRDLRQSPEFNIAR